MNLNKLNLEISAGRANQFPEKNLPEIAFSGKSNVGKSSLINCLVNRKSLARVSATPGKTVTVNFYNIDSACRFVDLPGYGYAKVSKEGQDSWSPVVDRYFTDKQRCDLVVQLIDVRHNLSANDRMMLDYLGSLNIPFVVILTKSDKLKKSELEKQTEYFKSMLNYPTMIDMIPFSSMDRTGRKELLELVSRVSGCEITGGSL